MRRDILATQPQSLRQRYASEFEHTENKFQINFVQRFRVSCCAKLRQATPSSQIVAGSCTRHGGGETHTKY